MDIFAFLRTRFSRLFVERDFSFARHTTIGCGGTAAAAVYPCCCEELSELLCVLTREKIPFCFMGVGANVLPPDGYYGGVVVRFSRMNALWADGTGVYAGAGVTGGALLRFARSRCLGGLEPFTGIPMTVGGGTAMNAGVSDLHFSDVVERVVAVDEGRIAVFTPRECEFGVKRSLFLSGVAVAGVYLKTGYSLPDETDRKFRFYGAKRSGLPHGRSMGCIFVNPDSVSAGRLIDECGLKGLSVGGARVSEKHANFIINEGNSSADVGALIDRVKREVAERTGIVLREEIRRIPATGGHER